MVRVVPEDVAVSAETYGRYLVKIQIFKCIYAFRWKIKDTIALAHSFLPVLSLMFLYTYEYSSSTILATVRMILPCTVASELHVSVIRASGMSVHIVALHLSVDLSTVFQVI